MSILTKLPVLAVGIYLTFADILTLFVEAAESGGTVIVASTLRSWHTKTDITDQARCTVFIPLALRRWNLNTDTVGTDLISRTFVIALTPSFIDTNVIDTSHCIHWTV